MNKTTVVHHSADFDGLFCREIAKKFLPDAELIGWDFGDKRLVIPDHRIYVLDLPVDRVFGFKYEPGDADKNPPQHPAGLVWIDHHKSSIETHPTAIPGYRIDGVAACRLAWAWFATLQKNTGEPEAAVDSATAAAIFPDKAAYVERRVTEPLAVRLAGEYDIWDKRDPNAELFQHGLRSQELTELTWKLLLIDDGSADSVVESLLHNGKVLQFARTKENESVIKRQGFDVEWEGLKFLACNHAMFNSHLFTAGIKPEHEALLGFRFDGKAFHVSLYHAPGKEHHDLSLIAVKHGGGGHRGACGFRVAKLPFI